MMLTYTEIIHFDEAFESFLQKMKQKPEIVVDYYVFYGRRANHYAWIGYETIKLGIHGIHYNGTTNEYYFGTVNNKIKSVVIKLRPPQVMSIPPYLTDGMMHAANNQTRVKIKKP